MPHLDPADAAIPDRDASPAVTPERFQRSTGEAVVRVVDAGGAAALGTTRAAGSAKLRFPRGGGGRDAANIEAMVLNTSGGLASGDRFRTAMTAEAHRLTMSTLACERVYRCEEAPARVEQAVAVAAGASLRHLPQPTILFDGARLRRHTRIDVASGAGLTFCEGLVLGREAMGECVAAADVVDRVELRVDGRLTFVDAFGLDAGTLARAAGPAALAGARGVGLVLHIGPTGPVPPPADEEAGEPSLGEGAAAVARAALAGSSVRWGASNIGILTVVRVLAPGHTSLQDALGRAVVALSGAPLPRAWQL
ncbi:urease accessory protein UreD [Acuticoccus sp. I52.16.1]|uniref:urease accessory protein UreD n=1 Tax=Acuticoccus sp. I52.16.1 TaxID=2928472 RepID=UPI001FCF8EC5|nr:urease accessory protein UreD [Acuticoccus sp. I52.16.1]UOM33570.1 urease accessory protein UreD [Acuticoccus sp. I52.16.1]